MLAVCGLVVVGIGVFFIVGVRDGSPTAWIVAAAAGGVSVGLMAVVNLVLRSDFRRPLLALASLWTVATLLAAAAAQHRSR